MDAFLLINLSEEHAFEQPVLAQVRQCFPAIPVFDVDAGSDAVLQQYAVRFLQENPTTVVCVQAGSGAITRLMPLLDELLQAHAQRHVLLLGEHPRLHRMFQARPGIAYTLLPDRVALRLHLSGQAS